MRNTAIVLTLFSLVFSGCAVNIRSKAALLSRASDTTLASLTLPSLFTHYSREVTAGTNHTCFRDSDGSLKCWGDNTYRQIKTPLALSPITVPGVTPATSLPTVTQNPYVPNLPTAVSAEAAQTCVVRGGSLQCVYGGFARSPTWSTKISSGVTAVSSGRTHTCAIVSGALQCFGDNTNGQIGTGATSAFVSTPYTVFSSGVTAVAAGWGYTCAIVSGALKCFGNNGNGQIGNGTSGSDVLTPHTTIASGVTAVGAGAGHTCAVVSGALQCWGSGLFGEIGNGIGSGSFTPYTAIASGVNAVAVGWQHTCALVGDALKCFGGNDSKQTGDFANSTTVNNGMGNVVYTPYTAIASGVTAIATGGLNTCAVVGGALKCFGHNDHGQIGNGTSSSNVASLYTVHTSGVTAVAMSMYHTCALVSDLLKCSGNDEYIVSINAFNGVSFDTLTPITVALDSSYVVGGSYPYVGTAEFKPIAIGMNHTCVVGTGGSLQCWGLNDYGQIGDGTAGGRVLTPYTVFTSGVTSVAAGNRYTCAVVNGSLQCWGYNQGGRIGNGLTTGNTLTPFTVFSSGVSAVSIFDNYTCAIVSESLQCFGAGTLTPQGLFSSGVTGVAVSLGHHCAIVSGALKCWGENRLIGNGVNNGFTVAANSAYTAIASGVTAVSVGLYTTCAVASGALVCFGENGTGNTGAGTTVGYTLTPHTVIASGVTDVAVGWYNQTCAVVSGAMQCFGGNTNGEIGNGSTGGTYFTPITSIATGVTNVGAGYNMSCGITSGNLQCFGANDEGQLGLGWAGNSAETLINTPYTIFSSNVSKSASGQRHTCAIVSGALKCTGDFIGDSSIPANSAPTTVISSGVTDLAAGVEHTCAVVSGALKCFGSNSNEQIHAGAPTLEAPGTPYTVIASDVVNVFAAGFTTCAVKSDRTIWCFGNRSLGLFNDGIDDFTNVTTPTQLTLPAGTLVDFSMSHWHACAILDNAGSRNLYCWGGNLAGEIVNDSVFGSAMQNVLVMTSATLEKVELGGMDDQWSWEGARTCVIDAGALKCFGQNNYGQIDSSQVATPIYAPYTLDASGVSQASARGYQTTCALNGNDLKCWGRNDYGNLGSSVANGTVGTAATVLTSVGP